MDNYSVYVWIIVMILSVIIEGATTQLVSIWIALGAVAALIAKFLGADFNLQFIVFIAVTFIVLILTRPLVKKAISFKKEDTNSGRYIGKEGIVTQKIDNLANMGIVNVLGSVWTARSIDGSIIEKDEKIIVDRIEGVKLIVIKK